jgi:hypothetical protein
MVELAEVAAPRELFGVQTRDTLPREQIQDPELSVARVSRARA